AVEDAALRGAGWSQTKIAALRDLAQRTLDGTVPGSMRELEPLSDADIIARLTTVRGIGVWTVQMLLIFRLARPDVLPAGDFGVRNGFRLAYGLRAPPHPQALAAYAQRWAPWRTVAAWYLWRACDLAQAGRLPPPPRPAPRLRKPAARRRKPAARRQ
ncbi:MAG: hypothetical protein NZM12_14485, partial [Steroidobacteraceae bacterium]|nr:hypothetical protein [Steroidobacteraceae bacterium]MDW8260447.1 hypothetical protein [Gammaproteobacteria bacterium]